MFYGPLDKVERADLQRLIDDAIPEGVILERLATQPGYLGQRSHAFQIRLGQEARAEILAYCRT